MKKIELTKIPVIGTSNFSNIVNKAMPVLESIVEDQDYVKEKLNVGNASLPDNVVQVKPPLKLNTTIVSNYFINPSNISKIAGIQANNSCIVSAMKDGHQVILNACNPPDIQIAPGKKHVIEMTNNFVGVWNKSDILSNKTTLSGHNLRSPIYWTNDFFRVDQKNDTFDPSIIYDPNSHRWFSTVIEFEIPETLDQDRKYDKMGVILAYSAPDDYKRWTIMKFSPRLIQPDGIAYVCPDRPMIYVSTDKVLISMTGFDAQDNYCSESGDKSKYLFTAVFDKAIFLDGSIPVKPFKIIYMHGRNYHYVPVRSYIDSPDINLVNVPPIVDSNSQLTYLKVNGSGDSLSCHLFGRDLDYLKNLPPDAVQKGTNTRILLADNRIIDAVSPNGNETWITFHQACKIGDEITSCNRMVKFTVEANSVSEECLDRKATNSTNRIYEGGNRSDLSKFDTPNVVSMVKAGQLPNGVAKRVISTLINDSRTVSDVAVEIGSKLNTTIRTRLNATNEGNLTSGIINMVKAAELPNGVANSVVSILGNDPETISLVADEARSQIISDLMIKRDLDFQVGSGNYYYFYPSLALSKDGDLIVYFGFSSKDNYPSLGLAVINTTSLYQNDSKVNGPRIYDPILVKNGTTYAQEESITNTGYCSEDTPCTRYGDYFSIQNDPFDDSRLWAAGEYYDGKYFSTVISSIRLP